MPRAGQSLASESPELESQAGASRATGKRPSPGPGSQIELPEPLFPHLKNGSDGAYFAQLLVLG